MTKPHAAAEDAGLRAEDGNSEEQRREISKETSTFRDHVFERPRVNDACYSITLL